MISDRMDCCCRRAQVLPLLQADDSEESDAYRLRIAQEICAFLPAKREALPYAHRTLSCSLAL
jgi:hypothetical protein